jgi:hypothetical protein
MIIPPQLRQGVFIEKKQDSKINSQRCSSGEIIQTIVEHSYEEATAAVQRKMNVALKLSSMRIVVVDIDNKQALAFANKKGLSSTLTERTARGYHLYYSIPEHVLYYHSHTYKNGLELKCTDYIDSNLNVVCSPSCVSGVQYEVVNDVDIAVAPVWILDKIRRTMSTVTSDRVDLSNVPQLLDNIDYDDYHAWLSVGMVLHNIYEGSNEGFELWCEWSSQSHKYDYYKTRMAWSSFDDYTGKKKGYGSLVYMSKRK